MEDTTKAVVPATMDTTAPEEVVQSSETDTTTSTEAPKPEEDINAKYSKLENEYKSVTGKMSSLQKEANALKQVGLLYEALNKAAFEDPEFKKLANKKLVDQGILPASVLEEEVQTSTVPTNKVAPIDPEVKSAVEWTNMKKSQEIEAQAKFITEFESDKPELNTGNTRKDSLAKNIIGAGAAIYMEDGLDPKEAFNKSYRQWFKAKQDADVDALLKQKSAPSIGGGLGGTSTKPSLHLTEKEKRIAKSFGLSDEEYAAGK